MPADSPTLHEDAHYLALKTRDARFDGRFFTGVTSTGLYCRPVCKVRTPKRENCRFFALAAQAERAGFRPCLRCRPELAPGANVAPTLAKLQALTGIGTWTAQYIAMRALRWPDALPAHDVALHKAMGVQHCKSPAQALERIFAPWSPWRSYAVVRAWHTLAHPGEPPP